MIVEVSDCHYLPTFIRKSFPFFVSFNLLALSLSMMLYCSSFANSTNDIELSKSPNYG